VQLLKNPSTGQNSRAISKFSPNARTRNAVPAGPSKYPAARR
jgi:hypothetical protein